jgi:Fe-S-cluster containining protein
MDFENYCKRCRKEVHCCIFKKGGFTFVSPKRAKEIQRKIKKEYNYFLDYSPLSKKMIGILKKSDPALEGRMRYSQLDRKNRILRLKTGQEGRCIFLGLNGKCEIYGLRPNICRIFPFWGIKLTDGRIKVIAHDIDSQCLAIKSLAKKNEGLEKALPRHEMIKIRKIFRDIEKEAGSYQKQIKRFVKESGFPLFHKNN